MAKSKQLRFHIGDLVRNPITHPDQVGEIIEINRKSDHPYRIKFLGRPAIWHPENELEETSPLEIYQFK